MRAKEARNGKNIGISFEFFPPKNAEMEAQLWSTVEALKAWDPEFVSVTYGAGGSTQDTTLATVRTMIRDAGLAAASHLTCVGATREDVHAAVAEFRAAGVKHFVALRGDPQGGIGSAYQPFPGGYANAAELTAGLTELGGFEISVAAYPEKHPESADTAADIDMLKRKVDAGATRALTQFFFDNDVFERYLARVRAAGINIPVLPGILPIHNLAQVKKFAALCGASVPAFVEEVLAPVDDDPQERAKRAAELASAQVRDLMVRGIDDFHFYTMNRPQLVTAVLEQSGLKPGANAGASHAA
ncbi:methylenetetrahydrofolate reductase [NAD(P)H] [Rhizobium sp. KVB221]|uniref:Methylenetetrahydrofolate reductase n=1 Tax=Rhizobium setariae TaxID=2801340 RepID=A0A937CQI0_9HYPH|nr:methylenetetrahydrofolate reductase [NAD(P)H] [Rhizobium setariae]MBL0374499.1 methylenetetrahydrofolate reductase [NAD(P)H] [Rhizobium setariae]